MLCTAVLLFLPSAQTYAEDQSNNFDFLIFVSGDYARKYSVDSDEIKLDDFTPTVDIFFLYEKNHMRFLADYLLTDKEAELERLQLGYQWSEDLTIWLGRFHDPISNWSNKFHHGKLLQTSISRPEIEKWEDNGGVLPIHSSGLFADTSFSVNEKSAIKTTIVLGLGPIIEDGGLIPFDFLDAGRHSHGASASLTGSYFPDVIADSNFGVSAAYTEIRVESSYLADETTPFNIYQTRIGAQLDARYSLWHYLSAFYHVSNTSSASQSGSNQSFDSFYFQAARTFGEDSTVFFRGESTSSMRKNRYIRLFHDFTEKKLVVGYRYELNESQAISIELNRSESQIDTFNEARIQWSAVIP